MAEENHGVTEEVKKETPSTGRVEQFIDEEGEKIRQETDRVQNPIIAKARQEYKKRLIKFLEEEREKIRGEAEQEAAEKRSKAESEAHSIIAQAQVEKQEIIAAGRTEAQTQAQQMIEEAKQQVNMAREREVADGRKEADTIIAEAKQNAERLTSEATELARKSAEEERTRILAEAKENAANEAANIVSESWRKSQEMVDGAEIAFNMVRNQLRECGKVVAEAERRMAMVIVNSEGGREQSEAQPADIQVVV